MSQQELIKNYANLSIRKLDPEIRKNGFTYRLVKRSNDRLIYAQHNELGEIIAYEVFLNKLGDLQKAKMRWCKLQNKSFNANDYELYYEIFPNDEDFGKRAWTYATLEIAEKAYNNL